MKKLLSIIVAVSMIVSFAAMFTFTTGSDGAGDSVTRAWGYENGFEYEVEVLMNLDEEITVGSELIFLYDDESVNLSDLGAVLSADDGSDEFLFTLTGLKLNDGAWIRGTNLDSDRFMWEAVQDAQAANEFEAGEYTELLITLRGYFEDQTFDGWEKEDFALNTLIRFFVDIEDGAEIIFAGIGLEIVDSEAVEVGVAANDGVTILTTDSVAGAINQNGVEFDIDAIDGWSEEEENAILVMTNGILELELLAFPSQSNAIWNSNPLVVPGNPGSPDETFQNMLYIWTDLIKNNDGEVLTLDDISVFSESEREANLHGTYVPNGSQRKIIIDDIPAQFFFTEVAEEEYEFASKIYVVLLRHDGSFVPGGAFLADNLYGAVLTVGAYFCECGAAYASTPKCTKSLCTDPQCDIVYECGDCCACVEEIDHDFGEEPYVCGTWCANCDEIYICDDCCNCGHHDFGEEAERICGETVCENCVAVYECDQCCKCNNAIECTYDLGKGEEPICGETECIVCGAIYACDEVDCELCHPSTDSCPAQVQGCDGGASCKHYWLGDITGTGSIGIMDALEILKHLAKLTTLEGHALNAAIIIQGNNKTTPTILDALEILKYLAKLPNELTAVWNPSVGK